MMGPEPSHNPFSSSGLTRYFTSPDPLFHNGHEQQRNLEILETRRFRGLKKGSGGMGGMDDLA